tara:strand:- start:3285 stop:3722 length:438 start_codon:yes stop_codon:yes gene_type:complete
MKTHLETYKIAKEVKKITGLNFLEKNRKIEYVEARSFFVHILKNYYKLRNRDIINIFNELGFKMDSATLCHAINMFEIYEHNNTRMQEWFDNLFAKPDFKNRSNTSAYIKSKLKYLPEDTLVKIAAQIDAMIKDEVFLEETEWKY